MMPCERCGTQNTAWPCSRCGYTPTAGTSESQPRPGTPLPLVDPWAPKTPAESSPIVPPPRPPTALIGSARTRNMLIAGVAALALVVGLGWAMNASGDQGATTALKTATATVTTSPTADATPTPPPPPKPTPKPKTARQQRADALAALNRMRAADAQRDPIRGQWVAQLASKFEGVKDSSQQATPFTVPQILAEVNRLKRNPKDDSPVLLVLQGDWGGSKARAKPLWVTFADISASSRDEAVAWCESHFEQRGKRLLAVCYPREMRLK